jgi:voltage-gated potassium channel
MKSRSFDRAPLVLRAVNFRPRLVYSVLLLLGVVVVGTLGYHFLEGWPILDALYMTIITMGTVGYGETHPLDSNGRLFTMFLIIASLGIAGYALTVVGTFIVEGELYQIIRGRRMDKRITNLADHIIICGGGRVGRVVAEECYKTHTSFVLVEKDPETLQHTPTSYDFLRLQGDATEDDTLKLAGIARARGLIATLGEDKDNVFVVLTARSLNPKLRIIARAGDEKNIEKLLKAGADEVVSPNMVGGMRMASVMLRPAVVTFLDQMLRVSSQTLRIEEVHVDKIPGLVGKTLAGADIRQRTGMLVVALMSRNREYQFNPSGQTLLKSGDVLMVMGTPEQIAALHQDIS